VVPERSRPYALPAGHPTDAREGKVLLLRFAGGFTFLLVTLPAPVLAAEGDTFIAARTPVLVALFAFAGLYAYYLYKARTGMKFFIRRIAGLEAIDEAIGRATEMGRPVLFVPGIEDVDNVQTLAGLSVLSHIAHKTASNEVELFIPNRWGMVMSTAQEVVKESHLRAGRPDSYKADNIYYVSEEQFALVAHASGLMARERPAANFFIGGFYAESLILAETGYSTNAIQIAGTANAHQLPFFVAACDYCLIGEELFAASAYLSRDARQMATIKGQDAIKLILLVIAVAGLALAPFSKAFPILANVPSLFVVPE
jgi:hypothetical protein